VLSYYHPYGSDDSHSGTCNVACEIREMEMKSGNDDWHGLRINFGTVEGQRNGSTLTLNVEKVEASRPEVGLSR